MQQHWLILLLLVVTSSLSAHANRLPLNKDFVTSLLAKGDVDVRRQTGKNNLNFDNIVTIQTPSSAVQDWSLVCQQLCGAALGGAVCAPYCKNLPFLPFKVQLENAEEIMDTKKDLICPELCGLQLGDDVCTCKNYNTNGDFDAYMKAEEQTNVCAIICDYNSVTLTGCTPCNRDKNNEYMILENVNNFNQKQQRRQQVVPYGAIDTSTPTTPDWNQLCASLCKTGDGGSLCNCDLSPFYI
ncbi:uncharacterized protein LOC111683313 [Lucilia cuprina]|uniref:uncharacterized protein LOC111683313 n=1 Tax=Lucilia cuprina TaxID=7375 RepID=UPI001F053552|nr:uncharacterized protein LOC111683313 [Lucilia cuprina]